MEAPKRRRGRALLIASSGLAVASYFVECGPAPGFHGIAPMPCPDSGCPGVIALPQDFGIEDLGAPDAERPPDGGSAD